MASENGVDGSNGANGANGKKPQSGGNSFNLVPIVEAFNLETTLLPRLVETIDWYCEQNGIFDPEEQIAQMFRHPSDDEMSRRTHSKVERMSHGLSDVAYNGFMADLLAYASTWAYADPATFAFMMSQRGMKRWRYYYVRIGNAPLFVVASAYLMQSYTGQVSILVFRGTEPTNAVNWLTDLTVSPERFLEGYAHGGIVRNLAAIWPLVSMGLFTAEKRRNLMLLPEERRGERKTDEKDRPDDEQDDDRHDFYVDAYKSGAYEDKTKRLRRLKAFYVTGHSLGGAMAALAAAQIWRTPTWREIRDNMYGCYTYGAPMVAQPSLADMVHKGIGDIVFRHVYAYDVVPQLPPRQTGTFKHFGQEYVAKSTSNGWLLNDMAKWTAQTPYLALLPMAGLGMVFEQFPFARALANKMPISIDHHSPRYYMRISEMSRTETL